MRRRSLTPEQAQSVGQLFRQARQTKGLSVRALEAASGVNISSIVFLERGDVQAPQPDTLRALAAALELPLTDVLTTAGWLPAGELPTLKPYLRSKYRNLDDQAITDLAAYAELLAQRAGNSGPLDHEDELPI